MARVYADVNQHMPKSYWEYDSVNITWGVLENYEVVRKIGMSVAALFKLSPGFCAYTCLSDRAWKVFRGL